MRQLIRTIAISAAVFVLTAASAAGQDGVVYDSVLVELRVFADGSVRTQKNIFASYGEVPIEFAMHRLNGEYVNGIAALEVSLDGMPCSADPAVRTGVVEAASGASIQPDTCGFTTWHETRDIVIGYVFPPVENSTLRHELRYTAATGRAAFDSPARLHWNLVNAADGIAVSHVRAVISFPDPPPELAFAAEESEFIRQIDEHTVEVAAANFSPEEWLRVDLDPQRGVGSVSRGSSQAESWGSIAQTFALVAVVMLVLWVVLKILGRRAEADRPVSGQNPDSDPDTPA